MSYEEADTCFNVGENKTLNFDPRNNPLFCLCFVLFVGKRFVLFVGKGATAAVIRDTGVLTSLFCGKKVLLRRDKKLIY